MTVHAEPHTETPDGQPLWLFGYGSLLFKPPMHHLAVSRDFRRYDGHVQGYLRRFWQSSCDNRGTPAAKGRVVTILPARDVAASRDFCRSLAAYELHGAGAGQDPQNMSPGELAAQLPLRGCVYRIPACHAAAAREYLDLREKDGYTLERIDFHVDAAHAGDPLLSACPRDAQGRAVIACVVYVGTTDNPSFVGAEPLEQTAEIIATCSGESGPNDEYLFLLQEQDPQDRYLAALRRRVEEKQGRK